MHGKENLVSEVKEVKPIAYARRGDSAQSEQSNSAKLRPLTFVHADASRNFTPPCFLLCWHHLIVLLVCELQMLILGAVGLQIRLSGSTLSKGKVK